MPPSTTPFGRKIASVLIPTWPQALSALLLALVIVIIVNVRQIFVLCGIPLDALNTVIDQYNQYTAGYLTTKLASTAALVTFWAMIGMGAYLICWSAYNLMIEARNEVTLTTQYTNRGHRTSSFLAIFIKIICAALLLGALTLQRPGFGIWLSQANPAFNDLNLTNVLLALAAVIGLAAQLYLVLALIIATFTPWYRK